LLNEYIRTIDVFSGYDNLLAFNIGNEVINLPVNTDAARESQNTTTDSRHKLEGKGKAHIDWLGIV